MVLYAFVHQPQTTSTASMFSGKHPHVLNAFLWDTNMFVHGLSSGSSGYAGVGNVNTAIRAFASGGLIKLCGCIRHCILYLVRPFMAFQLQKSAQWLQFTGVVYGATEILILGDCRYATQFLDNFLYTFGGSISAKIVISERETSPQVAEIAVVSTMLSIFPPLTVRRWCSFEPLRECEMAHF